MIILKGSKFNKITQEIYDELITHGIDPSELPCARCGHAGTVIHGYYYRRIKTPVGMIVLRIMRVRCTECGATHAVLLSTMVPYSWISLPDTVLIILSKSASERRNIMHNNPSVSQADIFRIRHNFNAFWKQKLQSVGLSIDHTIGDLCVRMFQMQFMQIHSSLCILFDAST